MNKSNNSLKLQIVSDLHLEFRPENLNFLFPSAPILCLLGDICVIGTDSDFEVYKKFISTIYDKYEMIIHVPGNHEYYNKTQHGRDTYYTIDRINKRLKDYANKLKKLHILNNNVLKLKFNKQLYHIIGSTLWSYVSPKNYKTIEKNMNDYKYIHVNDNDKIRTFKVSDMQKLHKLSVSCIKRFITNSKKVNAKCILLTHHKAFEETVKTIYSEAYESDLTFLFQAPVSFAAYGHTHKHFDEKINNIRVVSNPRGYPGQKTKFDNKLSVEI